MTSLNVSVHLWNGQTNNTKIDNLTQQLNYIHHVQLSSHFSKIKIKLWCNISKRRVNITLIESLLTHHFKAQKIHNDTNLDTFAALFAQHFNRNPTLEQCREIIIYVIFLRLILPGQ